MAENAFIWDLDGTLFDSYPVIVQSMCDTCGAFSLPYEREAVHDFVIRCSVKELCSELAKEHGLDAAALYACYQRFSESRGSLVRAIPHAVEALARLSGAGLQSFVYTHRGPSALEILKQTGLRPYLTEVLTAESGFPRKPDPTAILWLLDKYGLAPEKTWYVGDRSLDMEAAKNAHVRAILFLAPGSPAEATGTEDAIVSDLAEIPPLFGL